MAKNHGKWIPGKDYPEKINQCVINLLCNIWMMGEIDWEFSENGRRWKQLGIDNMTFLFI